MPSTFRNGFVSIGRKSLRQRKRVRVQRRQVLNQSMSTDAANQRG